MKRTFDPPKTHTAVIDGWLIDDGHNGLEIHHEFPQKQHTDNAKWDTDQEDERVYIMDKSLVPLIQEGYPVHIKITIETKTIEDKREFLYEREER